MEWQDDAIVIGVRRLGEADVILEAMTRAHGRHLGVVRGGRSRRLQPALQAGNAVSLSWRARLDEQLGHFAVEPMRMRAAAFMGQRRTLYALTTIAALVRLLPERDPHPSLFDALEIILNTMDQDDLAAPLLVRFEVALLAELGFGLDLTECAATGAKDRLVYVSPKSGRAVCEEAGEPYRERLFKLPAFLLDQANVGLPQESDVADGLALTGYFLERHLFGARNLPLPEAREALSTLYRQGKGAETLG